MRGEKTLLIEPREGSPLRLGTIVFKPAGELTQFEIKLNHQVFKAFLTADSLKGVPEVLSYPKKRFATNSRSVMNAAARPSERHSRKGIKRQF